MFRRYIPILLAVIFLFQAFSVSAAGLLPDCSGPSCTPCLLLQLISNVANFLVKNIMAPLAGLLFLIGGIMMIAAGGSEARFKKGKEIFINTAFGAIIVLASWLLVNTLIVAMVEYAGGDSYDPTHWYKIQCK